MFVRSEAWKKIGLGGSVIVVECPMTLGGLGGRIVLLWATFKLRIF